MLVLSEDKVVWSVCLSSTNKQPSTLVYLHNDVIIAYLSVAVSVGG